MPLYSIAASAGSVTVTGAAASLTVGAAALPPETVTVRRAVLYPPFPEPIAELRTGRVDRSAWREYFEQLGKAIGQGAPADAFYIVSNANTRLPNARRLVDSDTVTWDLSVFNQVTAHAATGSWVPLASGEEPLTFISDGAGSPVLVAFTP